MAWPAKTQGDVLEPSTERQRTGMDTLRLLEVYGALEEGEKDYKKEEIKRKLTIGAIVGEAVRAGRVDRARFEWGERIGEPTDAQFRRTYRMSNESFEELLKRIRGRLEKDERRAHNNSSGEVSPAHTRSPQRSYSDSLSE